MDMGGEWRKVAFGCVKRFEQSFKTDEKIEEKYQQLGFDQSVTEQTITITI
jgi:hypothetical protein